MKRAPSALLGAVAAITLASCAERVRTETVLDPTHEWVTTWRGGERSTLVADWGTARVFFLTPRDAALSDRGRDIVRVTAERFLKMRRAAAGELPDVRSLLPDPRMEVSGNTDQVEARSRSENHRLSQARAEEVVAELVRNGVAPSLISVVAHGADKPLVPTAEPEVQNRRVELRIRGPQEPAGVAGYGPAAG